MSVSYISTRTGEQASGVETVFRGLARDGGLYLPVGVGEIAGIRSADTLRRAEELVLAEFFGDMPEGVRNDAA